MKVLDKFFRVTSFIAALALMIFSILWMYLKHLREKVFMISTITAMFVAFINLFHLVISCSSTSPFDDNFFCVRMRIISVFFIIFITVFNVLIMKLKNEENKENITKLFVQHNIFLCGMYILLVFQAVFFIIKN